MLSQQIMLFVPNNLFLNNLIEIQFFEKLKSNYFKLFIVMKKNRMHSSDRI